MSKVQHQLLITLVHGTWGRGFFPQRQRRDRPPFWFEEGSLFLARLSTELGDIPHKVKPLLWSGANSIFERDKTAHALAEHLSTEHAEYPQAVQLAVAHSHGGNIALRALHHLQQRDSSQLGGADAANPLVVTLATPFIEIHQAHFGRRPLYVRVALMVFVLELFGTLFEEVLSKLFPAAADTNIWTVTYLVAGVTVFVLGWWWIARRAPARQNQLDALKNATRLGELTSAQRMFVGHLEQCSRAQVRVRSCFRLSSGLLFPPTASVGTLQTTPPSSCRGEPFQRHQAADVVGQVLQADLGARPHDANRSHDPTAWRVLLRSEHMLDASAYLALGMVHSHLR
jgi:hypothetical protein